MPIRDYASLATKVFHVYCDSAVADDSGDGRSWATAKKTLEAAVALLPDVALDHVVLHLKGTFSPSTYVNITTNMKGNNKLLIVDGGDDVEILDGPYTSTGGTTTSLIDTVRSWTPNQYRGYAVEILDGALIGHHRTIESHTADTLNVLSPWSSAPTTIQYRIVRPATAITATSTRWLYYTGMCAYDVYFQRLRFTGKMRMGALGNGIGANLRLADIVHEGTDTYAFALANSSNVSFLCNDPDSPGAIINFNAHKGTVFIGTSSSMLNLSKGEHYLYGPNVLLGKISADNSSVVIGSGRYKQIEADFCTVEIGYQYPASTPIKIDASPASGILLKACSATLTVADIDISNSAEHGIELRGSSLEASAAALSGTGNTGAGIYAHSGSKVSYPDGSVPTITGTVGDIAITDPATEDLTWVELDAAGKAVIAAEDVILKKV